MTFYIAFGLNLVFLAFRFFRSQRIGERTILSALFLFLILVFAVHPGIIKISRSLTFLETAALVVSFLWLAGGPFFSWLERKGRERKSFLLLRNRKGPFSEIVEACGMLSEAKQGGLIAIERKDSLDSWIQTGTPLDARIRRETIYSVFTPPGALHDGGMIIQNARIAACGVLFPLSKRLDLPTELGTRHRAGLGLSEVTDALTIIVSEETGKVSLADRGSLLYDVKFERLAEMLETALRKRLVRSKGTVLKGTGLRSVPTRTVPIA